MLRRWLTGSAPEPLQMMGIALLALAANVTCMALLAKHRDGGAHMWVSWILDQRRARQPRRDRRLRA